MRQPHTDQAEREERALLKAAGRLLMTLADRRFDAEYVEMLCDALRHSAPLQCAPPSLLRLRRHDPGTPDHPHDTNPA